MVDGTKQEENFDDIKNVGYVRVEIHSKIKQKLNRDNLPKKLKNMIGVDAEHWNFYRLKEEISKEIYEEVKKLIPEVEKRGYSDVNNQVIDKKYEPITSYENCSIYIDENKSFIDCVSEVTIDLGSPEEMMQNIKKVDERNKQKLLIARKKLDEIFSKME